MAHYQGHTCLYRLFDGDELLYVGVTRNTAARWASHAATKEWWPQVTRKAVEWYDTRAEALEAETRAIYAEKPTCNAQEGSRPASLRAYKAQAYTPSPDFLAARERWEEALRQADALREQFEAACIAVMLAKVPANKLAPHTPWSGETLRNMARSAGVPLLRNPTVKSIKPKPKKRTAPAESA